MGIDNVLDEEALHPLQRSSAQLADSIAQLTGQLKRLKDQKKAQIKVWNERIKDLENEIDGEQRQYEMMCAKEGK